jgi:hypothetical protein
LCSQRSEHNLRGLREQREEAVCVNESETILVRV